MPVSESMHTCSMRVTDILLQEAVSLFCQVLQQNFQTLAKETGHQVLLSQPLTHWGYKHTPTISPWLLVKKLSPQAHRARTLPTEPSPLLHFK